MSVPGYTAELSLRRANGHYRTAFTSPHVQGMVVPQMMDVFTYIPEWALESGCREAGIHTVPQSDLQPFPIRSSA